MTPQVLFQWWNAIYSIPLIAVLIFLLVGHVLGLGALATQGIGGALDTGVDSDADVDVDVDVDVDLDVGHDVDLGHDLDLDVGVDHDAHLDLDVGADVDAGPDLDLDADVDLDVDIDADADMDFDVDAHAAHESVASQVHSPWIAMLQFLGGGKAPLMLVVETLLLIWGIVGLGVHVTMGAEQPLVLLWSIPISLGATLLGTRYVAIGMSKLMPLAETAAIRRIELVGYVGRVVLPVSEQSGTIHLEDRHGTLHRVRARSKHGALGMGQQVLITGYNTEHEFYFVEETEVVLHAGGNDK